MPKYSKRLQRNMGGKAIILAGDSLCGEEDGEEEAFERSKRFLVTDVYPRK